MRRTTALRFAKQEGEWIVAKQKALWESKRKATEAEAQEMRTRLARMEEIYDEYWNAKAATAFGLFPVEGDQTFIWVDSDGEDLPRHADVAKEYAKAAIAGEMPYKDWAPLD